MPKFTEDISTHVHRYLTFWLSPHKEKEVKYLEVGGYQGMTSIHLIETYLNHPLSRLDVVDAGVDNEDNALLYSNLVDYTANGKALIYNGYFHELYKHLNNNFYDFIYVDACHYDYHTLEDLVLSFQLAKVGCIIVVDDCNSYFFDVVRNIVNFTYAYKDYIKVHWFHEVCIMEKIKDFDRLGNKK